METGSLYAAGLETLRRERVEGRIQVLLVDADDTLWENMRWFEEAMERYAEAARSLGRRRVAALEHLLAIERRNTKTEGYGSRRFERSLLQALRELAGEAGAELEDRDLEPVQRACESIRKHPIRLLKGVRRLLPRLAARHTLWLVSKGEDAEQWDKIRRSGLEEHFEEIHICFEKNSEFYGGLLRRIRENGNLNGAVVWMIGNSPRSDIEAAGAAGLGTIWIPHHSTWRLEEELRGADLRADATLNDFGELESLFL